MSSMRKLSIGALGIAIAAAVAYAVWPAAVEVDVATVARGTFRLMVEDDGKTRVKDRHTVSAPVAGMLTRLAPRAGDRVEEGMVLGAILPNLAPMLDDRARQELEQRLGAVEAARLRISAATERARSKLAKAETDLNRSRTLVEKGVAPLSQLEREELAFKVARRDLEAAQFEEHAAEHEVELARRALEVSAPDEAGRTREQVTIRSPIAGRVLRVFQESAGPVQAGMPLLELADIASLEVVVDALTVDAVQVRPGAPATIEHWGGERPLDARVRLVEPGGFTKVSALGVDEQRVNVILDIISPPQEWRSLGDAFRVDARIEVSRLDDAIKVPTSALFRDGGGWGVFVVAEGRAHRRPVELIRRAGDEAAVATGLDVGETVVIYPGDSLLDGARVRRRAAR